jgi:hypothetical protein
MPSLLPDRGPPDHYGAVQDEVLEDSWYDETESFRELPSGQAKPEKSEILVPPEKQRASGRFAGAFLAIPDASARLLSSELALSLKVEPTKCQVLDDTVPNVLVNFVPENPEFTHMQRLWAAQPSESLALVSGCMAVTVGALAVAALAEPAVVMAAVARTIMITTVFPTALSLRVVCEITLGPPW